MAGIRRGARALGLDIRWRMCCVRPGTKVSGTADAVYLDVGDSLAPGVIDQHHEGTRAGSSSELVRRYPELVFGHLVGPWLERARDGRDLQGVEWEPVIVTHTEPDFDSLVAAYLVRILVEEGDFPPWAEALAAYASEIDRGRYRINPDVRETATHAIHLAYLAIQHDAVLGGEEEEGSSSDRFVSQMERGFTLLEESLQAIIRTRGHPPARVEDLHPGQPGVSHWRSMPDFEDAARILDGDYQDFGTRDLPRGYSAQVLLPEREGDGSVEVRAFVSRAPPTSKLNKYWVRAHGFPYYICPYERWGTARAEQVDGCIRYPRVIISLDPHWRDPDSGRRPTLRGLGYQLERAETQARCASGGDQRGGSPRFPDGYCDNDDPWYDGRGGHDHTIVDAPQSGTRLCYQQIIDIACGRFWTPNIQQLFGLLVYADLPSRALDGFRPIPVPDGISSTLLPFFAACAEAPIIAKPEGEALPPGLAVATHTVRRFPRATCRDMRLLEFRLSDDAEHHRPCLEDLIAWLERQRLHDGRKCPDYLFLAVRLGEDFGPPHRVERLLQRLGQGHLKQLDASGRTSGEFLFNSRTVIAHVAPGEGSPILETCLDKELMLYAAFSNETARWFSQRITEVIPREHDAINSGDPPGATNVLGSTRVLREDFLAFQTNFYQFDVTGRPRSQHLFEELLQSMSFSEHYNEVQSELDRLHQIEQHEAERRRASSDRWMEGLLFLVGVAGMVQTVLAFASLEAQQVSSYSLWTWIASVVMLPTALFVLIRWRRD